MEGNGMLLNADYVVAGRPIRDASDPTSVIEAMQKEVATSLQH
jgi:orotidine-5'-phosphate decarboxylase